MPDQRIAVGSRGSFELKVDERYCTQRGDYRIFSTPNMVLLLEMAAIEALKPFLGDGSISVGTRVEVQHLAPTLQGMKVRAEAIAREVDGRRIVFDVDIYDDVERVGSAVHERYVLDLERYVRRLEKKKAAPHTDVSGS
jgi:fluoroacetyl-CoA thioesterase